MTQEIKPLSGEGITFLESSLTNQDQVSWTVLTLIATIRQLQEENKRLENALNKLVGVNWYVEMLKLETEQSLKQEAREALKNDCR